MVKTPASVTIDRDDLPAGQVQRDIAIAIAGSAAKKLAPGIVADHGPAIDRKGVWGVCGQVVGRRLERGWNAVGSWLEGL